MRQGKILIVDDNIQVLESLKIVLKGEFHTVTTIKSPDHIPDLLARHTYDVVLLDMNFETGETSGIEGLKWLKRILSIDPLMVVILITAYGEIGLAVKAMKAGGTDFITKPWDPEKLLATLHSAMELRQSRTKVRHLQDQQQKLSQDLDRNYKLTIGSSGAMKKVVDTVHKVARTDANILLLGENGVGKEVIAREIHRLSQRCDEVFIPVDMASLSESLFESEMFGHVKGAFTDAHEERPGRFELAHNGTLFLDEIANLSLSLQSKILRVLQLREVTRVGSGRSIPVNIRILSATNRPVEKMVEEQTFREDLYFRLNTITIEIPPLRERIEDIPGLADHFLNEYGKKYDKMYLKFNTAALDKLCGYSWPGNVRELKHTIEKAIILSDFHTIRSEDLYLNPYHASAAKAPTHNLEEIEMQTISRVIKSSGGNYSRAARMLGISRTTLYSKIKKYGI
jgi:DNA-binding NtrC family response regulator